jgi:ribonuclease PH
MKNSKKLKKEVNFSTREISVQTDFCKNAYGSVLFGMGDTRVICAVNINEDVPEHAKKKNNGWLSAEYTMLPYSTSSRIKREFTKRDGRSVEIQRLVGRSLRAGIDLGKIPGYSIYVDCDVIQADGGTRTASITGGYIALKLAVNRMLKEKLISENPLISNIAAVSVGIIDNEVYLDLDYEKDSRADVDMNVVMNGKFEFIEIQGTGEKTSFSGTQLGEMLQAAETGIRDLIAIQNLY